ncbi:heterokaryon incompatibility protein-domain-containing protein, partial [Microdochium trichocladiopsis]
MQLRFHTDIPKGAKYTALSHRWGQGSDKAGPTTRGNIEERKNDIAWEALPDLFHDAVSLTLGLGVSYIWIDSLCIVQDDVDDWEREAASMTRIFNNALLTIAALYSDSPATTIFSLSGKARQSTSSPLLSRAWAFQDCLVSSRIAYIGAQEITFECRAGITCEDDWRDFVEHYSRLELTFEKDRLLALGGYAQQYAQARPGQQYLAGLWSGALSQQLLW